MVFYYQFTLENFSALTIPYNIKSNKLQAHARACFVLMRLLLLELKGTPS